jgi:hypothetical protein
MISQLAGPSFHLYRSLAAITKDLGMIKMQTFLRRRFIPSRVDSHTIPRGSIFPSVEPDEWLNAEISNSEMPFLVDPGIVAEPTLPRLVDRLPTSQGFLDAAQLVMHDLQAAEAAKRSQEFATDFDAMKMAILGLRLGDFQLSEIALGRVQIQSGMSDLLRLRLMCETRWDRFDGVFHPETKKTTIGEHNALVIARALFRAINILVT